MKALSLGFLSPSLVRRRDFATKKGYSPVHGFWPAEDLAELADEPTGCGEVARGGCFFASNFSVTRSSVLVTRSSVLTEEVGRH